MLLGSKPNQPISTNTESLVIQLLLQNRYAEAYELLISQIPMSTSSSYNIALCLFWGGNYPEALKHLNSIQIDRLRGNEPELQTDPAHNEIRNKQNQTNDYLNGMSESYAVTFPGYFQDAIVRLKTDCWVQLKDFAKVITIASPISNKGYKNINDALLLANAHNDNKI
jgi:hypothetical protein